MKIRPWGSLLALLACAALCGCDDLTIDDATNPLLDDTPCAAVETTCAWVGDTCDFSAASLNFCGSVSAPPSCFQGSEELVAGVVAVVPPQLLQGLDVFCTLTDGAPPQIPADATVCLFPVDDDICILPWASRSSDWDLARQLEVRFQASAGSRIVVTDPDAGVCDSLTISCQAQ